MPTATTHSSSKPWSATKFYSVLAVVCALAISGSWWANHRLKQQFVSPPQPLRVYTKVSGDFTATDRDGKVVKFSDLKGKVIACSYLFTKCPMGCAEVFGVMRKLNDKFASNPDFHLASIAVAPDLDPPDFLKLFAQSQGVTDSSPWTFMSGHTRQTGWDFMHEELKLEPTREIPEKDRLSECDICEHDLRIVLIDRASQVRGYYQVMVPDAETRELMLEKLLGDVQRLLDGE